MKILKIVVLLLILTLPAQAADTYFINLDNQKFKLDDNNSFKKLYSNTVVFINLDNEKMISYDNCQTWSVITEYQVKNYNCDNLNSFNKLVEELNIKKDELIETTGKIVPNQKLVYNYKCKLTKTKGTIIVK